MKRRARVGVALAAPLVLFADLFTVYSMRPPTYQAPVPLEQLRKAVSVYTTESKAGRYPLPE